MQGWSQLAEEEAGRKSHEPSKQRGRQTDRQTDWMRKKGRVRKFKVQQHWLNRSDLCYFWTEQNKQKQNQAQACPAIQTVQSVLMSFGQEYIDNHSGFEIGQIQFHLSSHLSIKIIQIIIIFYIKYKLPFLLSVDTKKSNRNSGSYWKSQSQIEILQ